MKTKKTPRQYLKLLFIVIISLVLAGLILINLNQRLESYINEYNAHLTEQIAFLLTEQVEKVIVPQTYGFDLQRFTPFNRNSTRLTLKKFIKADSKIRSIDLVDPDNQIVISNEPAREGQPPFSGTGELAKLTRKEPQVIQRTLDGDSEALDVAWPVYFDGQFRGHILTVVRLAQPLMLNQVRIFILWISGSGIGLIIFLVLWFTWRLQQYAPVATEKTAARPAVATDNPGSSALVPVNEPESVFSKLSEIYEGSDDLEKSFKQSAEKAHSMMRVLNQGLLILDLNMHIITHNEYILDVFQIRTQSTVQQKINKLLQKNPRLLEMYRRAKDPLTKEVKDFLYLNLINGRKIKVEVLARPFYYGEDITGVTFYIKNLDMLQELEETLQRSMSYGAISQLSSSIGHEIRNPLSSLAIHTEIVDSMVSKTVTDEKRLAKIKKSINILNTEVERLNKLIDQFFKLAKPQQLDLTYVNINDLMREIYDLVYQQALEKSIEIKKYFSRDLPMVNVSRDKLKQVIINLILNGYDAMPEGGELAMRTHYREGKVVISIKDTGHGIPANIRENIFDLYFTTKDSGSGIGLAICRKIIEAHEGKLYFETKTGVGTIFYIELPTSQN